MFYMYGALAIHTHSAVPREGGTVTVAAPSNPDWVGWEMEMERDFHDDSRD